MLEQYYRIDKAAGVHLVVAQDGTLSINGCSIVLQKGKLDIDKKFSDLKSIGELKKYLPAKSFIAVNISGRGVLQKQVVRIEAIDAHNFSSILPNANIDDFFVQNFESGDTSFVSFVRKSEADKWLEQLRAAGFVPLVLSFGPFPVINTFSQLNLYGPDVVFDGYRILLDDTGRWTSCKYEPHIVSPFPVKLGSEVINDKMIIPYSAAIQLVLHAVVNFVKAEAAGLAYDLEQTLENRKFKVNGIVILIVFFCLLLVNFVTFSWLTDKNQRLAGQVSQSAQKSGDLLNLERKINQQEKLLDELGWDGGANKSEFVDQIAALLPNNITLTNIDVNPVELKSSREKKEIIFENHKISVRGSTDRVISLNEWMARVKTKSWVKGVRLENYIYNQELSAGQFVVIINY